MMYFFGKRVISVDDELIYETDINIIKQYYYIEILNYQLDHTLISLKFIL